MNEPLLSVDQLAEILGVKKSWLYQHGRVKGPDTIPMYKIGKYCRYKLDEVMEWIERQNRQL